ncbi:MAG: MFS transporter [Chloroflexota bacterium]|nr:MFS transporter [Chloroflexota bacterium]MDE2885715.1 MFS transporter [Chloroflexota bacterium]
MFRGLAQRTPFYYGWVVAGAVLVTMTISGAVAAPMFSVFFSHWTEEFGWSRTAISGGFSAGTIAAAVAGPLVGRALDRYGGRLVMGGGALLMAASVAGLGFMGSLVGLYVGLIVGRTALMSIQNLGGHTVIANWFVRRRAFATAVAVNGSRLGLGLWPLLGAALIAALGWREALWAVGALMALLALFPLVAIVSRQPEDVGLYPDGRPPPDTEEERRRPAQQEHQWRPREAVRTRAFWLLLFAHMGAMLAGGGFGLHRIPLFLDRGLEESLVGPLLLVHSVGMLAGGFIAAWVMGRTSYRVVIAACMAGASAAMAVVGSVPAGGAMVAFTLAESSVFGGVFAMLPVVYAEYFGRDSLGTIRGIAHPVVVASNAVGPVFAGYVFETTGTYGVALAVFSVVLGVGALSAFLARRPVLREALLRDTERHTR